VAIPAALNLLAAAAIAAGFGANQAHSPHPRPIAEFEPVRSVVISDDYFQGGYDAAGLARAVLEAGAELLVASPTGSSDVLSRLAEAGLPPALLAGVKVVKLPHGNLWVRDYGPMFAREDGKTRLVDFVWGGGVEESERFPVALGSLLGRPVTGAALELDGGNLLSDGATCVTSRESAAAPLPKAVSFAPLGCQRLVVLDDPPHAHVDMWLKLVGPGKALVAELDETARAALRRYYGGHVPEDHVRLGARLDAMARELAPHFAVERVPMPVFYRGSYRTYANALLVNRTAIVPRYKKFGWGYDDYPDAAERESYEKAVEHRYAAHGFSVTFVDADGLIFNGGAFHCVALQIPE
jgi:hypothetical protein